MKIFRLSLVSCLAALLLTGCISTDPVRFARQVQDWVPLGTPVADAQRIMEKHKFICEILDKKPDSPLSVATLICRRKAGVMTSIADWEAEFDIRDGKVAAYGHIDL